MGSGAVRGLLRAGILAGALGAAGVARADEPARVRPLPAASPAEQASARQFVAQGDAAFASKRYEEAAGHYRGAVAADGSSVVARYRLGVALAAHGDLEGAIEAWEGVLGLDPQHEAARRNIDQARLRHHKLAPPESGEAVLARARPLVADGRWQSALVVLDRHLARPGHSHGPEARALRARARLDGGDVAGCLADALVALAGGGAPPAELYQLLAAAYEVAGDAERAAWFRAGANDF